MTTAASSARSENSGLRLVAVEEVLDVDEHPAAVADEELDGVGDHRLALVERRLQRLGDVVLGALGDDAHRRRAGLERLRSVASSSTLPRGRRVEPNATSVLVASCSSVCGAGEELDVLRVGARPAALDEVHAEVVELLGDAQLVLDGRRDALDLQAVAQGRVEDLDGSSLLSWLGPSCLRCIVLLGTVPENGRSRPEGGFDVHAGWATCTTE